MIFCSLLLFLGVCRVQGGESSSSTDTTNKEDPVCSSVPTIPLRKYV